jgi:hypothetical protein
MCTMPAMVEVLCIEMVRWRGEIIDRGSLAGLSTKDLIELGPWADLYHEGANNYHETSSRLEATLQASKRIP